jgi:exosortase A
MARLSMAWRPALARLALAWAAIVLVFLPDWAAMAEQWWNISTYNHVLLIPPIIIWLVHERTPQLARLTPQGWWPGLVLAGAAGFVWVLGEFAGLTIARELGIVALLASAVPALLGPRVSVILAFPLGYMAFLVPFGDEIVPQLQMITAGITIALVHLSGVPAAIDGVFITTPAGLFEVAEACSGVKFLIAMAAFGVLAAGLCFESWRRRAVFLAACVAVPILANGVRAWGTIYAAQWVGADKASGIDHIIYGWIFFAIVIALVLALSWSFFDRPPGEPAVDIARIEGWPLLDRLERLRIGGRKALLALLAVLAAGQLWARTAEALSAPLPNEIALPEVPGWHRIAYAPRIWWEPRAEGADHRLLGRYADAKGHEVDVFLALYASQDEGREAGGFGEGALMPNGAWAWLSPGPAVDSAKTERLLARGRPARLAYTWYHTGDLTTGSNARLKLANMADRLLLRARPTTMLIVSAEERDGKPARAAMDAFRGVMGPPAVWMDRITRVQ